MGKIMGDFKLSQPWFCLLTPEGPAGVAVWAIGGESFWDRFNLHFQFVNDGKKFGPIKLGAQVLGRLAGKNFVSDEVLLVSTTVNQIPILEIHGHGGNLISQMQRKLFIEAGFQEVPFFWVGALTGKTKLLSHLEQVIMKAQTSRAVRGLINQSKLLPGFLSQLARNIIAKNVEDARCLCNYLISGSARCIHWVNPFKVAIMGQTNVGKSSLVNCLLGTRRVVVSDIPGTTIDPVQVQTAIDGWPIEFCDTAGLRDTNDCLEEAGIQLAGKKAAEADLILWLFEAKHGQNETKIPMVFSNKKIPLIQVGTKVDLLGELNFVPPPGTVFVSSKNRMGIDNLQELIVRKLLAELPDNEGKPTAVTVELVHSIGEIEKLLEACQFQEAFEKVNNWLVN